MPLKSGSSKETISQNIATERRHGKSAEQAAAIAFAKAREALRACGQSTKKLDKK
jgi:hypothetical protein